MELNLDGVLVHSDKNSPEMDKTMPIRANPKRPRKALTLTFSDNSKPYGTALNYWMERGLATPLIWTIVDELASNMNDNGDLSEKKLIAFVNEFSSQEITNRLLEKLKS